MRDFIFTLVIIAATALLIYVIRFLTRGQRTRCVRPRAKLILYYETDCECIEYDIEKVLSSPAMTGFELSLRVVDVINTPESRAWLEELRKKTGVDFEIVEAEDNGKRKYRDDKRDC